jgi:AcrR family transcriptional regulator
MPIVVDHDARRQLVTEVAAGLVAQEGRVGLSARRVADAAGHSTTIVSHYFADMAELMRATNDFAAARSRARIEAVLTADPTDIVGLAEALLPIDEVSRADWRIWLSFFGDAVGDPEIAAEQRARTRRSADRFHRCLVMLAERGQIADGVDLRATADRLGAFVLGVAVDATFDARKWTVEAQRRAVRAELSAAGIGVVARGGGVESGSASGDARRSTTRSSKTVGTRSRG